MFSDQQDTQGNLRPRSRTKRNSTTLAIVNTIMLAGAAHAQSTTPAASGSSTNAPTKLPDVVVTGQSEPAYNAETLSSPKYTEPLRDIPQSITVIPQSVMEDQGVSTLRDALKNVTGISIQAGEGGVPAGDNLSIRGFNARTDIFVDGVRDIGGYSRDPFNTEQIEVTKGPSSSTAGRGSTGGSINLATKTPKADAFYNGSFGFGTDNYKRFTADFNQPVDESPIKGTALRLNGMWNQADTPGRDIVNDSRWGVAPSLAFGLGTPTRVTLSYLHLDQNNIPDYGLPWVPDGEVDPVLSNYVNQAPPVDFSNWYGLKARDYEKTITDIATAILEHDFSEDVKVRNATRFGQNYRDSIITAPRFVDIDPLTPGNQYGTVIRRSDWKSRDQTDRIVANQTDVHWDFETGPVGHSLVGGMEFFRETEKNYTRVATGPDSPTTDIYSPNPYDPYTEAIARDGTKADSTADSAAFYAFDTIKLHEKWEVSGGLRWDHFALDYTAPDGTASSRTDEMLSWRAGLVFKPKRNGSIYGGVGTSFNPSAEGLTLGGRTDLSAVPPEESITYEVGTKWDFMNERLSASGALFRTEKTNARTPSIDPSDPPQVLDGVQTVQGVELGISGKLTPDWQVFGGYTYMTSEIENSNNADELGNALANTPEHTFSMWTTYKLPWDLQAGAGAQFVGDRYNSNTGLRAAPSYWLFDAMLGYEVTEHLSVRLNVYNLADERYIDRVGGGHFIPGAGRSAVLTASMKF